MRILEIVNGEISMKGPVDEAVLSTMEPPVLATPLAAVAVPVTVAKAAGVVVGAGAVTGAAYAAYRTVAN